jgi:hypothetical protein
MLALYFVATTVYSVAFPPTWSMYMVALQLFSNPLYWLTLLVQPESLLPSALYSLPVPCRLQLLSLGSVYLLIIDADVVLALRRSELPAAAFDPARRQCLLPHTVRLYSLLARPPCRVLIQPIELSWLAICLPSLTRAPAPAPARRSSTLPLAL